MNKNRIYLLGLGLITGLATANLSVAEQADTNTDQVPEAELKEFNGPTILSRRVWLETFIPLTFVLPHKWAVSAGYESKVDFENDNYVTNRAKIAVAKNSNQSR